MRELEQQEAAWVSGGNATANPELAAGDTGPTRYSYVSYEAFCRTVTIKVIAGDFGVLHDFGS